MSGVCEIMFTQLVELALGEISINRHHGVCLNIVARCFSDGGVAIYYNAPKGAILR
jgi:hypothetical protein